MDEMVFIRSRVKGLPGSVYEMVFILRHMRKYLAEISVRSP